MINRHCFRKWSGRCKGLKSFYEAKIVTKTHLQSQAFILGAYIFLPQLSSSINTSGICLCALVFTLKHLFTDQLQNLTMDAFGVRAKPDHTHTHAHAHTHTHTV